MRQTHKACGNEDYFDFHAPNGVRKAVVGKEHRRHEGPVDSPQAAVRAVIAASNRKS